MSRRTTSKDLLRTASRQASPLSATATLKPSSSRTPRRDFLISASSSTTRMEFIFAWKLCSWLIVNCASWAALHDRYSNFFIIKLSDCSVCRSYRLDHDRQLHDEAGAHWLILFNSDISVVLVHDPAHYRQAQSSPTFLG